MGEFDSEEKNYAANKARLLSEGHGGFFVLIKGPDIVGIYKTAEEAYKIGLGKFGNVPMFIKRIAKDDPPDSAPALMFGLLHARL